jgi:uncharacterized membrane protein YgdD (TMEM256/DUF423 family)
MQAQARRFCQLGAVLLALATVLGALGAHAWRPHLTAERYEVLQTALNYQFFHSLGLMGLGLLLDRLPLNLLQIAGWLLFAGVVLFSGSLYLLLIGAPRITGILTPIGGAALIAAWCLAAWVLGTTARRTPH